MNLHHSESYPQLKLPVLKRVQTAHPQSRALRSILRLTNQPSHLAIAFAVLALGTLALQPTPSFAQAGTQDPEAAAAAQDTAAPAPSSEIVSQATGLVGEAFTVAGRTAGTEGERARIAAARGAAAILPRLDGEARDTLTARWINIVQSGSVSRAARLSAYASFFDGASRRDPEFARRIALGLPDAAARAGAFVSLSQAGENADWRQANSDALFAQRAARSETDLTLRARALTFVALRFAVLNPELREAAVIEASSQARLISTPRVRDYLLAEIVGAAAKFDLGLAQRIASTISDEGLKGLATSRINLSEISQTTLTAATSDRIAALAKAASRYDVRAIPILIQLPVQADVIKALSDALPPIYPSARPAIEVSLLERIWAYTQTAEASVERDELQSRLARLMVLNDLWRGRDWGKQLAWKGGRIQVGAFLKAVTAARRSAVKAEPLQDLATANVNRAILQSRSLAPAARVEATLLVAGQLLN